MTITVGMPIHNNATTLARAVASVRAQTHQEWRLILADDASTDNSRHLAQDLAREDARIEVAPARKRLHAMNFGVPLQMAETPWFVWLAADDFWAPRFLEACMDALRAAPDAVSALPLWRYTGDKADAAPPRVARLDQPDSVDRLRCFLAAPGGTRMYGLTRTEVLRVAFPRRNLLAYDWLLMTGVLKAGRQVTVPETLLFRDPTDLIVYVEAAKALPLPIRAHPALPMSLRAVLRGDVPRKNMSDLSRLNLRKHEEYLAWMRPKIFARRACRFRRLGLPISKTPGRAAAIMERLLQDRPERKPGEALAILAHGGDGAAALALGRARANGLLDGSVRDAFQRAAELGEPDGTWHLAALDPDQVTYWPKVLDAARRGSQAARAHIRKAQIEMPDHVRPIAVHALADG